MPQFQRVKPVVDLLHMAGFTRKGDPVGAFSRLGQKRRIIIGQKRTDDLFRQLRVREVLPRLQIRLRKGLGHIQTAVRCKSPDNCLGRRDAACFTACALIFHA